MSHVTRIVVNRVAGSNVMSCGSSNYCMCGKPSLMVCSASSLRDPHSKHCSKGRGHSSSSSMSGSKNKKDQAHPWVLVSRLIFQLSLASLSARHVSWPNTTRLVSSGHSTGDTRDPTTFDEDPGEMEDVQKVLRYHLALQIVALGDQTEQQSDHGRHRSE